MKITQAADSDQMALRSLWLASFEDINPALTAFFKERFRPADCLVCKGGKELLAALYMLPSALLWKGKHFPAHYIYAASTLPAYRGQGLMARLLQEAAEKGEKRGEAFSFLLPAEDSLYGYYAKHGYSDFFAIEKITAGRESLLPLAGKDTPQEFPFSAKKAEGLRSSLLKMRDGSVLWEEKDISYAEHINRVYGGITLCVSGGYAFCRRAEDGTVEITELMAEEECVPGLLRLLLGRLEAEKYCFRLPCGQTLFPFPGEKCRFGMIRSFKKQEQIFWNLKPSPYLGLTLD